MATLPKKQNSNIPIYIRLRNVDKYLPLENVLKDVFQVFQKYTYLVFKLFPIIDMFSFKKLIKVM